MTGRLISYQTYVKYANKYNIDINTQSGKHKSMETLQTSIYDHATQLINSGKTVKRLYYTKESML
jgi:hypothetical protein